VEIKVQQKFGDLLTSFGRSYSAINDKAIESIERFFENGLGDDHPRLNRLMTKDAYSFRVLGNNAPGGPRVVMAKGDDDTFIPLFIGNHRDYDKYLNGHKIEEEIEQAQSGQNLVNLETNRYKKSADMMCDPVPRDKLEFGHFSTPEEGRYVTCQKAGLSFTEAQLAVFEGVSFDADISSITSESVAHAMDELRTAKSIVMECSPQELKGGVETFQMVYYEMDKNTRSEVFNHLGLRQDWSHPEYADQTHADNDDRDTSLVVLLMADFQRQEVGNFADHVLFCDLVTDEEAEVIHMNAEIPGVA
tara:strand:+ start:3522 stop:4433 length:912 start_codon:yes stop_codon:yes gene_type:complete